MIELNDYSLGTVIKLLTNQMRPLIPVMAVFFNVQIDPDFNSEGSEAILKGAFSRKRRKSSLEAGF